MVPDFICNVIESAFYPQQIGYTFYNITEDLSPDFEDIKKKLTSKTKALLCVNYFGYPAPFERIRSFCKLHNLYFIEDNSHGFLGRYDNKPLGSFGDISITSVYKSVPVIHGAFLRINFEVPMEKIPGAKFYLNKQVMQYYYRYLKRFIHRSFHVSSSLYPLHNENSVQLQPDPLMNVQLNTIAIYTMNLLNLYKLRANRRKKYNRALNFIEQELGAAGKIMIPENDSQSIPFHIPFLLVGSDRENEYLIAWLIHNNIQIFKWPTLPQQVFLNPGKYPFANYFRKNLIHFPI